MRHPRTQGEEWLPVRLCRTWTADGRAPTLLSVYCPERGVSIPLDECMACDHCGAATLDESGRASFVRCRSEVAVAAAQVVRELPAVSVPIGVIMTHSAICVRDDLSLETVAGMFVEHGIGGAPVVDHAGRPIGVISQTDILRLISEEVNDTDAAVVRATTTRGGVAYRPGDGFHLETLRASTVAEVMTAHSFSLQETATVAQAAALMAYEGIHRVPVVARDGSVVGIVSTMDLARFIAECGGYGPREAER